jgi:hypothetical protein
MAPFDRYTMAKIRDRIREAVVPDTNINRALYDGDHWLGGDGWTGPRPQAGEPGSESVIAKIARAFVSKNVIREVCDRHAAGVIGREPAWKLSVRRPLGQVEQVQDDGTIEMVDEAPTEQEQAMIDEAEAALTEVWDERGMLAVLQDALTWMLLAKRGIVRLYVPPGLLQNGRVPQGDLAESLKRIYVHAPSPEAAAVYTDPNTQLKAGLYSYTDPETKAERAEIVALDDQGRTIIRVLGTDEDQASAPLDLGGQLTMAQMERSALITPQVRQQQALLNLALTMLGRNVEVGGFIARILFNAQLPGAFETIEGVERFVPEPIQWGAGVTNNFMGAEIRDEHGRLVGQATPSYVREQPVEPATFLSTKDAMYRSILEEVQQLHAQISGDAAASGESRKQARADFEQSLSDAETQLNKLGRWLIETTLAMATAFSGQPGRFAELRAVFECRIDTGPLSTEELRLNKELSGDQPLFSQETAMARSGIDDVDAELERIAAETQVRQARAMEIAQAQGGQQGQQQDSVQAGE